MEYKKKKNGADHSDRRIFIGIGITCVIGVFVLLMLFNAFTTCGCSPSFNPTVTSIVATNNAVATLIEQTDIAATEQFMMTRTALP